MIGHLLVIDDRYALCFVSGGERLLGYVYCDGFEVGAFKSGSCGEAVVFVPSELLRDVGAAVKTAVGSEKSEATCLAALLLYAEVSFFVRSMKMDSVEDALDVLERVSVV